MTFKMGVVIWLITAFYGAAEAKEPVKEMLPGEWALKSDAAGMAIIKMGASDSSVWMMSYSKVKRYDKKSGTVAESLVLTDSKALEMAVHSDERIYVASMSNTDWSTYLLTKYNGESWESAGAIVDKNHMYTTVMRALTLDPMGRVWYWKCGYSIGFVVTGLGWGTYEFSARTIFFSSDDRAWIAGNKVVGIMIMYSTIPYYSTFTASTNEWRGIVAPDSVRGCSAIAEAANGDMLFGNSAETWNSRDDTLYGIARYDGENWTVYTKADGLLSNSVFDIDVDRRGTIWASTNGGISCYYNGQWISDPRMNDKLRVNARIDVDNDGVVWVGSGGDLYSFTYDSTVVSKNESSPVPETVALYPACPNPFNMSSTISFTLPRSGKTRLTVHDITGARVATLVDSELQAGAHEATFDGAEFPSGVYLYVLEAGNMKKTGKMLMIK